jgi:DNA-binding XRE family transcriptional regulator
MESSKSIKSIRGKRLLTQDNMAEMLKVSRQVYNGYENDILHCDLNIILNILLVLNVTVEELDEFFIALRQDYMSYKNKEESE